MKKSAFTLIELLVVIFLMGLILSIAVLNLSFLKEKEERIEVEKIITSLNNARNLAVNSGRSTEVILFKNEIYIDGKNFNENYDLKNTKFFFYYGKHHDRFYFNPTGAPDLARTIRLKGKDKIYSITIEIATGKVNLRYEKN